MIAVESEGTDIMDAVKTSDLVVLDDIGVEKVTDFVEETFTRILITDFKTEALGYKQFKYR
ncbi:hypothetical protein [Bacillus altitudinis]